MFKEIIGRLFKSLENNPRQTSVTNRRTFYTSKFKINLPAYYKECFDAWSAVNWKTRSCYVEISNEIILNNKSLCCDKNSMYRRDLVNLGFVKIMDLISADKSFSCDFSSLTNPEQRFFLMSIINSIPAKWRLLIKASTNVTAIPIPITPTIKMASGNAVPVLDISPKEIYQIFLQHKQGSIRELDSNENLVQASAKLPSYSSTSQEQTSAQPSSKRTVIKCPFCQRDHALETCHE